MSRLIPLTKGRFAIVDPDDFEWLSEWRWAFCPSKRDSNGYALFRGPDADGRRRTVYMHRLLANAPAGLQVDHINGDPLDNRRANLRLCTQSENNRNTAPRSATGLKGVYRKGGRYVAQITVGDRKTRHLGSFATPADAAAAYNAALALREDVFARPNPEAKLNDLRGAV